MIVLLTSGTVYSCIIISCAHVGAIKNNRRTKLNALISLSIETSVFNVLNISYSSTMKLKYVIIESIHTANIRAYIIYSTEDDNTGNST